MKNLKKIVLWTFIITMIVIVICSNISLGTSDDTASQFHMYQAPRPTGITYTLDGLDAWISYWNVYCIEHDQKLPTELISYDVLYKVEFRGDECTFYNSEGLIGTTKHEINSIFGAIITPNSFVPDRIINGLDRIDSVGFMESYERL